MAPNRLPGRVEKARVEEVVVVPAAKRVANLRLVEATTTKMKATMVSTMRNMMNQSMIRKEKA